MPGGAALCWCWLWLWLWRLCGARATLALGAAVATQGSAVALPFSYSPFSALATHACSSSPVRPASLSPSPSLSVFKETVQGSRAISTVEDHTQAGDAPVTAVEQKAEAKGREEDVRLNEYPRARGRPDEETQRTRRRQKGEKKTRLKAKN